MINLLLYVEQPIVQHAICALLGQDDEFSLTVTKCISNLETSLLTAQYDAILFATKAGGGKFNRKNLRDA